MRVILLVVMMCVFVGCKQRTKEKDTKPIPQAKASEVENEKSDTSLAMVLTSSELPLCTYDIDGKVYFVQNENVFIACTSKAWIKLDLQGPEGQQGIAGEAGKDGSDGADGEVEATGVSPQKYVYDANDNKIGYPLSGVITYGYNDGYTANVLLDGVGIAVKIRFHDGVIQDLTPARYYTSTDCSETPYVERLSSYIGVTLDNGQIGFQTKTCFHASSSNRIGSKKVNDICTFGYISTGAFCTIEKYTHVPYPFATPLKYTID